MKYENIKTKVEKHVLTITLDRPKAMNALSPALLAEIASALNCAATDAQIGSVVLRGNERAFAAGADIAVMADLNAKQVRDAELYAAEMTTIRNFPKPIVAAVAGYALGGGFELAMACDIIIVGESAQFGLPEINLGVIPGMGGTQRLIRAIGKSRATEMIMTGNFMMAEEAVSRGLASRVVHDDELAGEAQKLAEKIALKPALALQGAKVCLAAAANIGLDNGLLVENEEFATLFDTHDQKEGMAAFLEKREAKFKNN